MGQGGGVYGTSIWEYLVPSVVVVVVVVAVVVVVVEVVLEV
jgi:hypothetical protein